MALEKNDQNLSSLLFLFLALILATALGFLVIKPISTGIIEENQQIQKRQEEIDNKEQKKADLEKLKENYEKIKDKLVTISTILPAKKQHNELLVQLETVATDSGVFLVTIAPEGTKKQTKEDKKSEIYQAQQVTVKIVADFAGLGRFISGLEKNLRLVDIDSISVKNQVITLTINIYYQE